MADNVEVICKLAPELINDQKLPKNGSKHPILSISMAYNVISCKKIGRNTQKIKTADFTM